MKYLIIYIIIINLIGFISMGLDKKYAIEKRYRLSEKSLLMIALFLGSIGIYSGMYAFRHKTRHDNFTITVPFLFIINCVTVYFIIKMNLLDIFI